jgi:hypothetical protein
MKNQIIFHRIFIFFIFDDRELPAQDGIEWLSYYSINNKTVQQYYEFSNTPKPNGNFGTGLKTDECEKLWKFYIDKQ